MRENSAYWTYDYDALGQVTSAAKKLANSDAMLGHSFGYTYDDIGNRKTATASSQVSIYSPNDLNQYSQRTAPGITELLGSADAAAVVTSNSAAVPRQGELFYKQSAVDNSVTAQYSSLAVQGVQTGAGPGGTDVVVDATRHAFAPRTPELFTYDEDGNLKGDGRWTYAWDAENRLVAMETSALAVTAGVPKQRLAFAYDAMGRRIAKKVLGWDVAANVWGVQSYRLFLYDGWNLLAELDPMNGNGAFCAYTWGLDLSGSLQGAGGVGGLIFSILSSQPSTHAPEYDGNGNVIGSVDMVTGEQSATYEYGAFGETLTTSGVAAAANPFRFSTKYTDVETGLLYYGMRYYAPQTGRWLSRDSLAEKGGPNLYDFVDNAPMQKTDSLGQQPVEIWASAFIPDAVFVFPYPNGLDPLAMWVGDGRNRAQVGGASRAFTLVTIETDPSKAAVVSSTSGGGTTKVFYSRGGGQIKTGYDSAPDAAPPLARVSRSSDNKTITVEISADTKDPLVPKSVTPSLHYKWVIVFDCCSGKFTINGDRKQFPGYDLIINKKVEHLFLPSGPIGNTPAALFFPPQNVGPITDTLNN